MLKDFVHHCLVSNETHLQLQTTILLTAFVDQANEKSVLSIIWRQMYLHLMLPDKNQIEHFWKENAYSDDSCNHHLSCLYCLIHSSSISSELPLILESLHPSKIC